MSLQHILYLTLAVQLTACASVVPLPDVSRKPNNNAPTLEYINKRITCELWETMYANDLNYDVLVGENYEGIMQLSLTVTQGGSLAPNFSYIESPMLSANLGIGYNKTRNQYYFSLLEFSFRKLNNEYRELAQDDPSFMKKYCEPVDSNLTGNLGIRETFEMSQTADQNLKNEGVTLSSSTGSFGGSVEFVENRNLNMAGPTWVLRHFRGPGSLAGVSGSNTDKIVFAFARGKKSAKPYLSDRPGRNPDAERLLQQININQLTTQLGVLGAALR